MQLQVDSAAAITDRELAGSALGSIVLQVGPGSGSNRLISACGRTPRSPTTLQIALGSSLPQAREAAAEQRTRIRAAARCRAHGSSVGQLEQTLYSQRFAASTRQPAAASSRAPLRLITTEPGVTPSHHVGDSRLRSVSTVIRRESALGPPPPPAGAGSPPGVSPAPSLTPNSHSSGLPGPAASCCWAIPGKPGLEGGAPRGHEANPRAEDCATGRYGMGQDGAVTVPGPVTGGAPAPPPSPPAYTGSAACSGAGKVVAEPIAGKRSPIQGIPRVGGFGP
jgi:hypothetical protein